MVWLKEISVRSFDRDLLWLNRVRIEKKKVKTFKRNKVQSIGNTSIIVWFRTKKRKRLCLVEVEFYWNYLIY
jgi:hypothetical protein